MTTKEAFVNINNIPTKIVTIGRWITEAPKEKGEKLILVIPGNPGSTGFYHLFIKQLHEQQNCPVWLIGHSGHEQPKENSQIFKKNFLLEDQINFKKQFIEEYVKDVELYIVGHSIGAYMTLELLKNENIASKIKRNYLLFPTLEKMATSPNGKLFTFSSTYLLWFIMLSAFVFDNLPRALKNGILTVYMKFFEIPLIHHKTISNMIQPKILNQIFALAKEEMKVVKTRNNDLVRNNLNKLTLLYGETDGWAPSTYYDEIKKDFPELKARMSSYYHSFVLKQSEEVANLVSSWINEN